MESALDHLRHEVARLPEEAADPLARLIVGRVPDEKLVDELGPREDASPRDARLLRPLDENASVEPLVVRTIHPTFMRRSARERKTDV